jgi:hypothetical protein
MRSNQSFYKLIIVYYSIDKNYKALGPLLVSDSTRLKKSYKDTNSWVVNNEVLVKNLHIKIRQVIFK